MVASLGLYRRGGGKTVRCHGDVTDNRHRLYHSVQFNDCEHILRSKTQWLIITINAVLKKKINTNFSYSLNQQNFVLISLTFKNY